MRQTSMHGVPQPASTKPLLSEKYQASAQAWKKLGDARRRLMGWLHGHPTLRCVYSEALALLHSVGGGAVGGPMADGVCSARKHF